jgi:DNA-binding response OmpR family regulator
LAAAWLAPCGAPVEVEVEDLPLDPHALIARIATDPKAQISGARLMGGDRKAAQSPPSHRKVNAGSKLRRTKSGARTLTRMASQILVVEDDEAIASGLERVLVGQGYEVQRTARGREALALAADVQLVVLDLGLPDVDGITVCRTLREARSELAILILSARDQELDVVAGLDAGADDYLVKPFRLSELLARVRAHVRRVRDLADGSEDLVEAGGVRLDLAARRAWSDGDELALRPKEFDLLALLVSEAGRVVTRERIMSRVWQTEWMGSTKTLDTHVLSLRQKLAADAITTLRGVGYRFEQR